jgi:hypothetical protein
MPLRIGGSRADLGPTCLTPRCVASCESQMSALLDDGSQPSDPIGEQRHAGELEL